MGIIAYGLVKGMGNLEIIGQVETIPTTAFLRSGRLLRRVLETWDLLYSHSREKPSAKVGVKNSIGSVIIIICNKNVGYVMIKMKLSISEWSKLAKKQYKSEHAWLQKVLCRKLSKKKESDHTNKWHMYDRKSVQENKANKILWYFQLQINHLISAGRPNLVTVKKIKSRHIVSFTIPAGHRVKIKERWKFTTFANN